MAVGWGLCLAGRNSLAHRSEEAPANPHFSVAVEEQGASAMAEQTHFAYAVEAHDGRAMHAYEAVIETGSDGLEAVPNADRVVRCVKDDPVAAGFQEHDVLQGNEADTAGLADGQAAGDCLGEEWLGAKDRRGYCVLS